MIYQEPFLSLWYDSTWDWTLNSQAIGEHFSYCLNLQRKILLPEQLLQFNQILIHWYFFMLEKWLKNYKELSYTKDKTQ